MSPPAASDLAAIDWAAPWLAPYAASGRRVAARVAQGVAGHAALNAETPAAPVHFVPPSDLPPGRTYESHVFSSGRCPTRDGLHDFFNGLVWQRFPLTKQRLNRLHVAQIAQAGDAPLRGAVRDGLTLFDENGAWLQAPEALWQALLAKDWSALFIERRALWAQARLLLFGHALLEKLVAPRKGITAHVYRVHSASTDLAALDAWVAADLSAGKLATKPFVPLPVLGVPGWWAANQDADFYADRDVFRPPQ